MSHVYTVLAGPGPGVVEARFTAPDEPGGSSAAVGGALAYALHFLGITPPDDFSIDGDGALVYSAVWGCVRAIVQGLAPLGWHTYERSADGRRRVPVEDPVAWLLDLQANPECSALAWREAILKDALTGEGGYAEIERTGAGRPNWLWRLDPSRVCPDRTAAGELVYEVRNGSGVKNTVLAARDVFHLKGLSVDGVVGYDVVALMRRAVKLGLQQERFGSQVFGKGPMPAGFLKVPQRLTPEQQREMRRSFEAMYSGAENAGRVVVLHGGAEFTAGQVSSDSAQALESRRFQVNEVCRFYGVPPHKLADLERATFSNIEEQEIAFVRDCLFPWARRLETEADIKLFGPVNRGRRFTRLNLDALMRGNSQTQTQTVATKVTHGLLTINEGRDYFDLNPIDGGDTPLIQGAMVRLEDVLDPAEPPGPPAPPPAPDPADPAGPAPADRAGLRRAFGALVEDVYARLLRVEADKAQRAANRGDLAAHAAAFYPEHERHVAAALAPAFLALLAALGLPAAGAKAMAEAAARRHVARSLAGVEAYQRAENKGDFHAEWPGRRPEDQAAFDLTEVLL